MNTAELTEALGYRGSPHFLPAEKLGDAPEHAHVFRRALKSCSLQGVYLLRDERRNSATSTPVVYVTQAESRQEADDIHRRIWNQNVVPFLIVRTPDAIRLYSGFRYGPAGEDGEQEGVLEAAIRFEEATTRLAALRAGSIDDGTLWRVLGQHVNLADRVDTRLLDNLEALGQRLRRRGLKPKVAHALIGKLVYLRYLRDRDILSDRRLEAWKIAPEKIFGRGAKLGEIRRLVEHVEEWLNGSIFPLPLSGKGAPGREHVEMAAGVFLGDEVDGQLHLDFRAYDFSYIPIETLSVIYEQFLAIEGKSRRTGAFYTPIPLVNFILDELDERRPLQPGMRVLDPSCGSGAFLVQCYRRLVERRIREKGGQTPRPAELRDLLVNHIFGVDQDGDACRVAELSLILTMLDYVDPPDLQSTPSFKLPHLRGNNVFEGDFFDPEGARLESTSWDWIVGNPPWVELSSSDARVQKHAQQWIKTHRRSRPVTDGQVAEAFAWRSFDLAGPASLVGLLLPAMTLFKQQKGFRQTFFSEVKVHSVSNLSNLRQDLFVKRIGRKFKKIKAPAAAFVYSGGNLDSEARIKDEDVLVYSPLLANHESNRPASTRRRNVVWNLTLNASEVDFVDLRRITGGDSLPWKTVAWGGQHDWKLIRRIASKFKAKTLRDLEKSHNLVMHEGIQLREESSKEEKLPVPEIADELELDVVRMDEQEHLHFFPQIYLRSVPANRAYVRKRGGLAGLEVCRPPHVIVSGARSFAVFSAEFIVVPPRQIGIAGSDREAPLLKALALYLSSDFAFYYEFFTSPQMGVREGRSTLETLKSLPNPFYELDEPALREWADLHDELVRAARDEATGPLFSGTMGRCDRLREKINVKVYDLVGLQDWQRWLVHDLVHVRRHLGDGSLGEPAVRPPDLDDLEGYALALRDDLDDFMVSGKMKHRIKVFCGRSHGAAQIELVSRRGDPIPVEVHHSDESVTRELERLRRFQEAASRQWVYFDRNLFIYASKSTYIFKPAQRFWWIRSQAMKDAAEIIGAALVPRDIE